jgi:hypothetical protein
MASHITKYQIIAVTVHVPLTAHRTSGISGLILRGMLFCGVRFGIDIKETKEEGGSSNILFFFSAYFVQRRL